MEIVSGDDEAARGFAGKSHLTNLQGAIMERLWAVEVLCSSSRTNGSRDGNPKALNAQNILQTHKYQDGFGLVGLGRVRGTSSLRNSHDENSADQDPAFESCKRVRWVDTIPFYPG